MKKVAKNINSNKNLKKIDSNAILVLQNGQFFKGIGLGCERTATGEVCFNTSITGYQEIISDPSYAEQIINFTFPHIGNVGSNKEDHESDKIWTRGVIVNSEITDPSNYRSLKHLNEWLKKNGIVGITGVDTRNLTNFIRDKGAPKGTISFSKTEKFNIKKLIKITQTWSGLKNLDLAKKVTTKKNYIWQDFKTWKKGNGYIKNKKKVFHVIAIDYGIKKNILRYFSDFNCKVTIVSCKTSAADILKLRPDGIFLSNGPGDPAATGKYAIPIIKELIKNDLPVFGICLGHQLLGLTLGAKKSYIWQDFKTWKKENGYIKNKKKVFHVIAIDYGIKKNILRYFSDFNCKVTIVSCKTSAADILKLRPDGIFLSNGPGDPAATGKYAIPIIKELIKNDLPVFGICLGHQLLGLTLGAKTKKMNLGHRGANHPVKNLVKGNVEITSQNHGFEIVKKDLPKNIQVTHKSLFDSSIEGIKLKSRPVFSVQYHPESNPGPQDSVYLFENFVNSMKENAKKKRY